MSPLVPVVLAPGSLIGTVVAPSTSIKVVPSMTAVFPEIEKLGFTGIVVGPGIMSSVVPSITVRDPARPVDFATEMATVVGSEMIK